MKLWRAKLIAFLTVIFEFCVQLLVWYPCTNKAQISSVISVDQFQFGVSSETDTNKTEELRKSTQLVLDQRNFDTTTTTSKTTSKTTQHTQTSHHNAPNSTQSTVKHSKITPQQIPNAANNIVNNAQKTVKMMEIGQMVLYQIRMGSDMWYKGVFVCVEGSTHIRIKPTWHSEIMVPIESVKHEDGTLILPSELPPNPLPPNATTAEHIAYMYREQEKEKIAQNGVAQQAAQNVAKNTIVGGNQSTSSSNHRVNNVAVIETGVDQDFDEDLKPHKSTKSNQQRIRKRDMVYNAANAAIRAVKGTGRTTSTSK